MRIAEISTPDHRQASAADAVDSSHSRVLFTIESSIKSIECNAGTAAAHPLLDSVSSDLRLALTQLSQLTPLPNSTKLHVWKLSYRLWNACVDLSNASSAKISEDHAKLRQVAADMLLLNADVSGIPSPAVKAALFFYKTGLIWHDLRKYDAAENCYEKASDLVSKIEIHSLSEYDERKLLLDLNLARSRTAWDVSDFNLSIALLNRSKNVLFGIAGNYNALANQYLTFGKILLTKNEVSTVKESLKLMNDALELCEKGLHAVKRTEETLNLKELRLKTLRFMAAAHLQGDEFESVLKCVKVLREVVSGGDNHPSLSVLAMKAWLGLGRYLEAEKELRGMVVNKGIPEGIWVSAVESYFHAAGAAGVETVKGVFLGLLERCHISAAATVRVVSRMVGNGGGEGMKVRASVVGELVADQRVVKLFEGDSAAKERTTMHALLWNCATEYFRSKDYLFSAEMFEKSMLYVPHGIENRVLRANGYRVLCLCYLSLLQLDRAEEYINEAERLEPNIASAFLKFKIFLQRNDQNSAIAQVQAMPSCLDFTTDFLSLASHEAIACRSLSVATAALSQLLNFYSMGKPMLINEAVVFRTLVTISSEDTKADYSDILKHIKRAHFRQSEAGSECFFGKGEVGRREKNWLASNAWNFGVRSGKEKKYEVSAEFFQLASDLYVIAGDGESEGNSAMVCKSLILCVSAIIASEEQKKEILPETEIRQTIELLARAGKIIMPTSSSIRKNGDHVPDIESNFFFLYTWSAFDLYSRLSDIGSQQLLIVKNYANSKSCNPKQLLQIGIEASKGSRFNPEVATFALNTCLSSLLAYPSPDYETVAVVLRKLICISTICKGDSEEDSIIEMFKQAHRIMVGLKEGEYPIEEAKWLATTAWNRAALPLKMRYIDSAKKWMSLGLELAGKVPGMKSYKLCMEEYVARFHNGGEGMSSQMVS